jgi:hypothetical protein
MITSITDRAFLRRQFPELEVRGLSDAELDLAIDAWFATITMRTILLTPSIRRRRDDVPLEDLLRAFRCARPLYG